MENKLTKSVADLLEQIPEDSESYDATKKLLENLQPFFEILTHANPEELKELLTQFEGQTPLYNEIGRITRSFYDQMKLINSDIPERLGEIANHDMTDATQRLTHIVEMTDTAANKTMDLAEEMLGKNNQQLPKYVSSNEKIESILKDKTGLAPEIRDALESAQSVIKESKINCETQQETLTNIMIAQDYQDLTGQVIQRIIELFSNLEKDLVGLIETFGKVHVVGQNMGENLQGPQHQTSEKKQSQEDTDALLASMGF